MSKVAATFVPAVRVHEAGRIQAVADGVLRIIGLPGARSEELLEIGDQGRALVLGLEQGRVLAALLDAPAGVREGDFVRLTGGEVTIGVGEALLGRVIDPLGRPLDGEPLRGTLVTRPVESPAPAIHQRAHVHRPLYTGTFAIDAMFPIGRGQRELIVGDEGTGKTTLALDALLRQRSTGVVGVYVAIGRRRAETWRVVEALRRGGGRWVVVATSDDDSPALRYIAPYAGTAVAEYFMGLGGDSLVVYDDLTAHAVAWRELSLLLRRPPGREAFPGDIFYLHSRLLERAAQLSAEAGGGSLTALPLAALEGGRLTSYIPTNLISITDGQIVLSANLFAAGEKPAIDATLSVSRVGAKAQPQAVKDLASRMRLDYAAFLELESFSRLGTRLEDETRRRIDLGRRIRSLLRARPGAPLGLFDEVVRLALAGAPDVLLSIPEDSVGQLVTAITAAARRELGAMPERVERDALLSEVDSGSLRSLIERVAAAFAGPSVEVTFDAG